MVEKICNCFHILLDSQMYVFGVERGFFFLKRETRQELKIETFTMHLPHTIMMNQFLHYGNHSGYVYSSKEDMLYHLSESQTVLPMVLIASLILEPIIAKLIYFLLNQAHMTLYSIIGMLFVAV